MVRRELGIRPINIPEIYKMKKQLASEHRYDEIMSPYVDAMFSKIDWPHSCSGRLLLGGKAYQECVAVCERETGYTNPRQGYPDILELITPFVPESVTEIAV